jgi:hypothetical protein
MSIWWLEVVKYGDEVLLFVLSVDQTLVSCASSCFSAQELDIGPRPCWLYAKISASLLHRRKAIHAETRRSLVPRTNQVILMQKKLVGH